MGLFDRLSGRGSEAQALDTRESFGAILLATIASDGHISDEEAGSFVATLERMKLFRGQSPSDYSYMIDKLVGLIRKHGIQALVERAASGLQGELRQTAFVLAVDLVMADGFIEEEEKQLLATLQRALHISDDLANTAIDVLLIKNAG